ncbi:ricin-type beta-trefoil lectin domain protein [Streptacidiphilus griseoplanus]|uniref:ricin-type beta-trefoil lectin domain protein n=1 Tax=Peterkaempfera griseoplana TaxID=66896 RepID=UPI0006E26E1C|nr:ricin-type beta-trefoil lectin domain protein [Peterkaempfera griseoplana]
MSQLHRFDGSDRIRPTEAADSDQSRWGEASLDAPPCTDLADAELTRLVRSDEPIALEAVDELRRRHLTAVLAYARICSRDAHTAEELADEAFDRAQKSVRVSGGPRESWRYHLLILVRRSAAARAAAGHRADLSADFTAWLDHATADTPEGRPDPDAVESRAPMPAAFRSLPERTQAILWHAVVEEDDDAETGRLLGLEPQSVPYLREKAREAYRDAYLQAHTQRQADEECRRFSGLVEAAARRSGVHHNEDLDRHLAGCPRCARVLTDLVGMSERPDAVLAEGLLVWGGASYVAARLARSVTGRTIAVRNPRVLLPRRGAETARRPVPRATQADQVTGGERPYGAVVSDHRGRAPRGRRLLRIARQFPAVSATAAVVVIAATAATTIVTLVPSNSSVPADGTDPLGVPPLVISRTTAFATVTATVPAAPSRPSASSSSASSAVSRAPKPGHRPTTSATASVRPTAGATGAPIPPPPTRGSTYSELVNERSGLCLDVADQFLDQGADVIVHSCTGATSQKWFLDGDHLLRNYANPEFCLDSRGDTDRGVGVWQCSSASGSHGDNLRFQLAGDGSIRPFIDGRCAVTPTGDGSGSDVDLEWDDGRGDQSWRAGATAVLQQS